MILKVSMDFSFSKLSIVLNIGQDYTANHKNRQCYVFGIFSLVIKLEDVLSSLGCFESIIFFQLVILKILLFFI
jgi:hypothetical protein